MKTKLTIILLCILCSTAGFAQQYGWVPLVSPTTNALKRIYVLGNEAWLLGDNLIFYSSNYPSVQVSTIYTGVTTYNDMTFINQGATKYAWVVGYDSYGVRTIDTSAISWTEMFLSGISTFNCVSFPNETIGYASGTDKRLHKTLDGGVNWSDVGVNLSNGTINAIFFTDTNTGFLGGSSPAFKKTTDGGLTWHSISGYTGTINDIYFYDAIHGWTVGANDIIYYKNSAWTRIANPTGYSLNSVFFINANEGWIVGNGGTILHSTDGGATWSAQTSGTTAMLRDVFFTSPTNGYAVGNNGTILHYTQLTGIETTEGQNGSYKLMQNEPNPFQSTTSLKYRLQQPGHVHLAVYNLQGEMICRLVNEYQTTGEHSVIFDGSGLPSGIYYYRIIVADNSETGKMMLTK